MGWETAPNKEQHVAAIHQAVRRATSLVISESRVFAASLAYDRVKSMSNHVFMIIYTIELISERYKTLKS